MKITTGGEARGVRSAASKRKSEPARGGAFAGHLESPSATPQAEVAGGAANVAALLAAQAVGDALDGRKQAYDRAESLLKRLDAIRIALLTGDIGEAALRKLAADFNGRSIEVDDPDLAELMAEIELRAAVELAKRGLA